MTDDGGFVLLKADCARAAKTRGSPYIRNAKVEGEPCTIGKDVAVAYQQRQETHIGFDVKNVSGARVDHARVGAISAADARHHKWQEVWTTDGGRIILIGMHE